jgi:hypothetical protein
MRRKILLIFSMFTLFMLYIGLWNEMKSRIRFNQWDIIGPTWRVTNHNFYSNIYIIGVLVFTAYISFSLFRKWK